MEVDETKYFPFLPDGGRIAFDISYKTIRRKKQVFYEKQLLRSAFVPIRFGLWRVFPQCALRRTDRRSIFLEEEML